MMEKTYFNTKPNEVQNYLKSNTYIFSDEFRLLNKYNMLPEEYDMFSELDQDFFSNNTTKQFVLISMCLQYMKECLVEIYNEKGIVRILPKLIFSRDNDGTMNFSMVLSSFRAFLSFDGERDNFDAYFGVVYQIDEDSIHSETSRLTLTNYKTVIQLLLQAIFNS